METIVALIAFAVIATLVMPDLLSKEIIIALVALGILAYANPRIFTREQVFALLAFGILFSLVIPKLTK